MCGINVTVNGHLNQLKRMQKATFRRGNKNSVYFHENVFVSFDLLAITDENTQNQPFECENYLVWLNGYISNYKEIALMYNFDLKTNCDTEVLACFLSKFNGEKLNLLNGFFSVFE